MLTSPSKLKFMAPVLGCLIVLYGSVEGPQDEAIRAAPGASPATANQEMPKPGAEHRWLSERVGKWKVATRMKMTPDAPWMESEGTETCTMACGGFWQLTVQKGSFMNMPLEGRMQLGFDQRKKKFVGTWIDNFGSYLTVMEGTLNEDKTVLTMHSDMLDPMSGKTMKVRMETTIHDKDKATFKMFMPGPDGKHFQTMEQTSTRVK